MHTNITPVIVSALALVTTFATAADFSPNGNNTNLSTKEKPCATIQPGVSDFNLGWRFQKGNITGAEQPNFDDRAWRLVDLPHDWSIEGTNGQAESDPRDKTTPNGASVGYLRGGIGWYHNQFAVSANDAGKAVEIIFDGVQQESEVWINGHYLGLQPHGYIGFHYDLTPYLNAAGEPNLIAVRATNPENNSRWYAGSGIYRQVALRLHDPLHIPVWGARIDTISLATKQAELHFRVKISNQRHTPEQATLKIKLRDPKGGMNEILLGQINLAPKSEEQFGQRVSVANPAPWSPETPHLYEAEIQVWQDNRLVDSYRQSFGIRTLSVSAKQGFLLNGQPVKLKGACLHDDNGLLGAAAFAPSESRRVAIMKRNGFNAIRTSHNPPSSAFLDACDRQGMLVLAEFVDMWEMAYNGNSYNRYFAKHWEKDLTAMIERDFNHPSVVMWSVGNEIQERNQPSGIEIARKMVACIRHVDARRPITEAFNGGTPTAFAIFEVAGYNYRRKEYEADHAQFPERVIVGTESWPNEALENWLLVEKHPYVIGDFVWTGMDHIGESGLGHTLYVDSEKYEPVTTIQLKPWPTYINWAGDIDIIGNKKPQSNYRDVVWNQSPVEILVHAPTPAGQRENISLWGWPDELPHWNWRGDEGQPLLVRVFSRASRVRLELNGRSLGEQEIDSTNGITASFQVPYEAGELKASALADGKVIATCVLVTSGPAAAIVLTPELNGQRADRQDLFYVPVQIRDAGGNLVPTAHLPLELELTGPAEVAAFGSANPDALGSLRDAQTDTFRGRALVILRSTGTPGTITLLVKSPGLPTAKIEIPVPVY